jgi:16S rRNA (cytosine967-C5)-methyltransferase
MTENKRKPRSRNFSNTPAKPPKGFASRREAVRLLDAILSDKKPFDDIWSQSLEAGDLKTMIDPDRALTRLIVMTTLRHMRHIDTILATFLKNPLPKSGHSAQNILRTAIAQLLFLKSPAHAVLNIATSLAAMDRHTRPFKGLINGVLRNYTRADPETFLGKNGAPGNTPEWLHNRWKHQFGNDHAKRIARAHQHEPALDISVKSDAQKWADSLNATLLPTGSIRIANAGNPVNLPGFDQGEWWVQDAAAAIPAQLLGDIAGKHALDLCAAPGGKTAQLLASNATVTAVERSTQRMKRLAQNLSRLGFNAELVVADAAEYLPPVPPDVILLDAPCSATGTIRRHPDVPYLKTHKNIIDLAEVQKRLIDHAAEILKPGGTLIYCVCSLEHEEGEDQISGLLERNKRFSLVPVKTDEVPGLKQAVQPRGDLRILPHFYSEYKPGLRGLDGFYIARLIKS